MIFVSSFSKKVEMDRVELSKNQLYFLFSCMSCYCCPDHLKNAEELCIWVFSFFLFRPLKMERNFVFGYVSFFLFFLFSREDFSVEKIFKIFDFEFNFDQKTQLINVRYMEVKTTIFVKILGYQEVLGVSFSA